MPTPAKTPPPPTCPICNGRLTPITLDPDTPPWLCPACSRGWWNAELNLDLTADPEGRGWGSYSRNRRVIAAAEAEHAAARAAAGESS